MKITKYLWFVLFCICLKSVSPRSGPDFEILPPADLQLITKITTQLTEASQKNLQLLIKKKLVENRQIPETASINIDSIYLDKKHCNLFAGQRYTVKSLATWISFFPQKGKEGLYILKMNKHHDYFFTQHFYNNLAEAKVDLSS
jgi:hypothetical protein